MAEESATSPASGTKVTDPSSRRLPLDQWRATLAAVRLPNTLLVAGDVDAGALDLTHAHPSGLATLMAGRPARLSSLVREPEALAAARRRVRAIRSAAAILALDRGIHAGYLAAGLARWRGIAAEQRPGNGPPLQEALSAPVLLRRCTLRPHGTGYEDFDLDLDAAAVVNPLLLHRLHTDHGAVVDGLALAERAFGPDGFNPAPVFDALAELCGTVPGFRIEPALLVGTFTAGSGQLLADLDLGAGAVRTHRVLRRGLGPAGPASAPVPPAPAPTPAPAPAPVPAPSAPAPATASSAPAASPSPSVPAPVPTPAPAAPPAAPPAPAPASSPGPPVHSVDVVDLDAPPPPGLVLDLDPEQRAAVVTALGGADLVVEGPPGTGLTQTLAAAAAGLVGQGKQVLVVTPHRGTAESFVSRLVDAGLGDTVLNLHDGATDRAGILTGLGSALESALAARTGADRDTTSPAERAARRAVERDAGDGAAGLLARFTEARAGLLDSADALHEVHQPWGVSAYQAMVALAGLMIGSYAPRTTVRLPAEVTRRLDAPARARLADDLREAAALGAFTLTRLDTRWLDARVHTEEEASAALDAAVRSREALPAARAAMVPVAEAAGLAGTGPVGTWRPLLDLMLGIRDTLDVMLPAVFEQPLGDLIDATAPRGTVTRTASGEPLSRMTRRGLRRRAQSLVRPGVPVRDLHELLKQAHEQRERWLVASDGGGWPQVPTGLAAADVAVRALDGPLATVRAALAGTATPDLLTLPLDKLEQRLTDLASDADGITAQPERTVLLDRLGAAGLTDLVTDLQERRVGPEEVGAELELSWWTSVLESVIRADPRLAGYQPGAHRKWVAQLRETDVELRARALTTIREAAQHRAREVASREAAQVRWLRAEVHRGHRSEWPADLFRRAVDLVGALRPVWVMSPDTVARVLPPAAVAEPAVDVVIIDDAGQVGMPEAAAAVARGTQLLVAGDRRRLPPATGGPSVLEFAGDLVGVHRLCRDHRTRDGRLLGPLLADLRADPRDGPGRDGVSGRDGVPDGPGTSDDRWRITPGVAAVPPIALYRVTTGPDVPPPGEDIAISPASEVSRVVRLVAEHARQRPGESLLVVTLGARHAERIEESLRLATARDRDLAAWLGLHWTGRVAEPFLVRPVHRIAGLERDTTILSVGMAKRPAPSVVRGFGVLDGRYGRACLRAALSRSRRRILVTSAFSADDLPPDGDFSDGMRLLRDVLGAAVDTATVEAARAAADHPADPGGAGAGSAPGPGDTGGIDGSGATDDARSGRDTGDVMDAAAAGSPEPAGGIGDEQSARAGGTVGTVVGFAAPSGTAGGAEGSGVAGNATGSGTAEGGGATGSAGVAGGVGRPVAGAASDALVADLRRRLEEAGMPVRAGIPAADRPLDLAVGDPLDPGRNLVAVDLDGPGYAACRSVRLRDRQRGEGFERAGWTYLQVLAMDLFCDPAGEVERIRDAWRAAGGLPATVVPSVVLPRPPSTRVAWPERVATGLPVSAYTGEELDAVGWWVVSDGLTRTRNQIAGEIRTSLGLPANDLRTLEAVARAAARVADGMVATSRPGNR